MPRGTETDESWTLDIDRRRLLLYILSAGLAVTGVYELLSRRGYGQGLYGRGGYG